MDALIDTDILVDVLRGDFDAYDYLRRLETQHVWLAVSVVTQMELIVGCRNKAELRALDKFLARFEIIKIDKYISDEAVELLKKYRLSHGLLIADAFIAATALVRGYPLASRNRRDYQFIAGLNLLPYP